MRSGPDFLRLLAAALPGLAVAGLVFAFAAVQATYQLDSAGRAELRYLGLLAALILATVALLRLVPAWELGLSAVLSGLLLAAGPQGTARAGALGLVLVLTFTLACWRRLAQVVDSEVDLPFGLGFGTVGFKALCWSWPLSFGAQVLLRGQELVGSSPLRLLVLFGLFPTLGALAAALTARKLGVWPAAIVTVLLLLVAPGWTRYSLLGAVAITAVALLIGRRPANGLPLRLAAGFAALLFAGTATLAAYPWGREQPLADALALLPAFGHEPVATFATEEPALLSREYPDRRVVLSGVEISELVIDSHLAHAATLAAGTPVARFTLVDGGGNRAGFSLEMGRDTGEWAAERPDVAALGSPAPTPFKLQLVPEGNFFSRIYRCRWRLPRPVAAVALEVSLDRALPADTQLIVYRAELLR